MLNVPVSFDDLYHRYGDSWRVPAEASLLCKDRKAEHGNPTAAFYVQNLNRQLAASARGVCVEAGVKNLALLDACTLDVAVLGMPRAAQASAGMKAPVAIGIPHDGGRPPGR